MYVVTDEQGLIHAIAEAVEIAANGVITVAGKTLAFLNLKVYEVLQVPAKVEPYKYTYSGEAGFQLFKEPVAPKTIEEQLAESTARTTALERENTVLQMSVMELTMYAAGQEEMLIMQDKRITTQESAVIELSMLIAGGMM